MAAKTLMIQGTASHVGKSVLTAGLCRLFARKGLRVAPFKAQNMSNNSFVTPEGLEIGRAQAVQALASREQPQVAFNPVLIKPSDERSAQLVVGGVVVGELTARDFGRVRREWHAAVLEAFEGLRTSFDVIILEGAGSPAEINLRHYDIVNMAMAREARAPVLLVGDIDRGGVFAALVGTLSLLDPNDRTYVKGFIVNKFRGEMDVLVPGLDALTERTGVGVLGVIPFWNGMNVPEEDSMGWESWVRMRRGQAAAVNARMRADHEILTIAVADVPYLSNFTDLDALAREPDVHLVPLSAEAEQPFDAVILPGTKNTAEGLGYLRRHELDAIVHREYRRGGTIIGLCGGYQMLGKTILDPLGVESVEPELRGLGLLDATTRFELRKMTRQVSGRHTESGCPIAGYEVHMGRTEIESGTPLFELDSAEGGPARPEGAVGGEGRVLGTYVHGVFDSAPFRRFVLNGLRAARGWDLLPLASPRSLDDELDGLADFIERHTDFAAIQSILDRGI